MCPLYVGAGADWHKADPTPTRLAALERVARIAKTVADNLISDEELNQALADLDALDAGAMQQAEMDKERAAMEAYYLQLEALVEALYKESCWRDWYFNEKLTKAAEALDEADYSSVCSVPDKSPKIEAMKQLREGGAA